MWAWNASSAPVKPLLEHIHYRCLQLCVRTGAINPLGTMTDEANTVLNKQQ